MISKLEYKDVVSVGAMLKTSNALSTNKVVKDLILHLGDSQSCIALKIVKDDEIIGVWCSKEFSDYISLSFFYMAPSARKKPEVAIFFKYCYSLLPRGKALLISSKDITGFEKYVKAISLDVYQFIGLR